MLPVGSTGALSGRETTVVIVCDPLFDQATGAPCGGPAEDAWLASDRRGALTLVDRFVAGPRRTISVYSDAIEP